MFDSGIRSVSHCAVVHHDVKHTLELAQDLACRYRRDIAVTILGSCNKEFKIDVLLIDEKKTATSNA